MTLTQVLSSYRFSFHTSFFTLAGGESAKGCNDSRRCILHHYLEWLWNGLNEEPSARACIVWIDARLLLVHLRAEVALTENSPLLLDFFILVSEKSEGCPSFWRITMRTVCYSPCCLVGSIQSFAFIRDIDKIRPSHTCAHKPVHRCLQTFFLQRATATSVILDKPHFLWVEKEYPCVFSVNDLTAA